MNIILASNRQSAVEKHHLYACLSDNIKIYFIYAKRLHISVVILHKNSNMNMSATITTCNNIYKIESNALYQTISKADVLMFDMDGTLIDTNYANYLSYTHAVQRLAKSNINFCYDPNVRFTREQLLKVIPTLSNIEYETITTLKNDLYVNYLYETKINEPITELLENYSRTKEIVLVTNSRKDRACITLKYHGLLDKFNCMFYQQDDSKIKNKYEYAITAMQINPASVVVFENETAEVYAAKLAGIPNGNIIHI